MYGPYQGLGTPLGYGPFGPAPFKPRTRQEEEARLVAADMIKRGAKTRAEALFNAVRGADESETPPEAYFHDGEGWLPLTEETLPQLLELKKSLSGE